MCRYVSSFALARWRTRAFISLGLSLALVCPALQAAPLFWDGTDSTLDANGGNGTWDDALLNWDTAAIAGTNSNWVVGSLATFGGSGGTITVSGAKSAEGLEFGTGGYNLSGGELTLVGSTTTLNVLAGVSAPVAISNNILISGSSVNIINKGSSTLTLAGPLARSGGGALTFNLVGPGNITINGSLNLGSGTLNKGITGSGSADNDGILTLSSPNTYGSTLIRGGTLRFTHAGAIGSGAIQMDDQGIGGSGAILDNATGALFTKNITINNTANNTEATSAKFTGGDFSLGNLTYTGSRATSVTDGITVTFTGVATTNATMTKFGGGTLAFTNSFQPTSAGMPFLVNQGTLSLVGASNANVGTITLNNGRILLGNKDALGTGGNTLQLGGSATTASSAYELTANTNLSGANAVLNPVTFGSTQTAPVFTISGTNPLQLAGTVALGTTANRQISTTSTATTTFSGVISGGPASGTAFTKLGTGILELTADNTYTGNTVISAGTLLINNLAGSATSTGIVTVNSSGIVGGNGSIAGNLLGAGTLAPGNSIGTLTVGGNADLDGTWLIELNGAGGSDRLAVAGSLTLDAATDLLSLDHLTNGSLVGTYTLATFGSLIGTFDAVSYEGLPIANPLLANSIGGTHNLVYNSSSIQLVPSVIPEPGTYALFALGSLVGLRAYRRRLVTA